MKKSMYILILCTMLTGCVNYETPTATANSNAYETTVSATVFTDETVIETASEVYDATEINEETSAEMTEETTVTTTEKTSETTQTDVIQTTSETVTTTAITSAEEEKSSIAETEISTTATTQNTASVTTEIITTIITTTAETTTVTTTTEIIQTTTEPPQNNLTDYEKALEVYNFMTANGSGTCVQYSYQTYQMCREYGLECYFTWTENKLYGHVANVVKVDGTWYVLDTQGGCFLRENMCGFTEIVDEYENHVADADIISGVRYG